MKEKARETSAGSGKMSRWRGQRMAQELARGRSQAAEGTGIQAFLFRVLSSSTVLGLPEGSCRSP